MDPSLLHTTLAAVLPTQVLECGRAVRGGYLQLENFT
jgi:hypothetical protein